MNITHDLENTLKYYVYVYIDPRNGEPFYIGRGKGNRMFSHLDDPSDTDKTERIRAIRKDGKEPQIDLLRYGLSEAEASLVEAASIDLIGLSRLTNLVAGHHRHTFGRIGSSELIQMLSAKPVKVTHKALLITINQLYRSDMSTEELYEATRGIWKLGLRREKAEFVMAVYQGIVKEVYRITSWHHAGCLPYHTRDAKSFYGSGRWEFQGTIATDVRDIYIGNTVGLGGQNPVRYMNI